MTMVKKMIVKIMVEKKKSKSPEPGIHSHIFITCILSLVWFYYVYENVKSDVANQYFVSAHNSEHMYHSMAK